MIPRMSSLKDLVIQCMAVMLLLLALPRSIESAVVQEHGGTGTDLEQTHMQSIEDSIPTIEDDILSLDEIVSTRSIHERVQDLSDEQQNTEGSDSSANKERKPPQIQTASISDDEGAVLERTGWPQLSEEEPGAAIVNVNGSLPEVYSKSQMNLKCGNSYNVELFRELNRLLSDRVIPIVCDDTMRAPLARILEDHCRLGVIHNICEAIPEECGPGRDQVAVFGGPLESKNAALDDSPKKAARFLHHFFWQYMNNSEAGKLSWVLQRVCTEKNGAPMLMAAIQHVDFYEPQPGDLMYYSEEELYNHEML